MKNSLHYLPLILLSLLLLNSCGRRGPVGPQGPPGIDGAELLPASFEFNVDLLQENGFEDFGDIPNEIDVIPEEDRKSTRLNSSHVANSYAVFCLKKKKISYK